MCMCATDGENVFLITFLCFTYAVLNINVVLFSLIHLNDAVAAHVCLPD